MKQPLLCHLIYEDRYFSKFLQNGIIIDSGVLLEFIKLRYEKGEGIILTEEEETLLGRLEKFLSIGYKYITSHILSELSNLINVKVCRAGSIGFSNCINLIREELNHKNGYSEIGIKKEEVLEVGEVTKFGVADAGIILTSKKDKKIILTDDENLSKECKFKQNLPTLHLNDFEQYSDRD